MTSLIFGVGLGLFVIISLWIFATLIFCVSLRIEKRIGVVAILSALIVTVVLISVPTDKDIVFDSKPYDHLFIWRLILLILLALSAAISFYGYIKFNLLEPARPQRIKSWVH